jgi:hypothetical protein
LKKAENGDTLDVLMEVNGQGMFKECAREDIYKRRYVHTKTPLGISSKRG